MHWIKSLQLKRTGVETLFVVKTNLAGLSINKQL